MVEYGEFFWKDGWGPLYSVLGGNPLAAMPSLHFATSMMAAQLLAETGPLAGALGWGYTATLGFALVYLGEHYVVDLLAGAALTTAMRRSRPARPRCDVSVGHCGDRGAGTRGHMSRREDEMNAADRARPAQSNRGDAAADELARDVKAGDHEDVTVRSIEPG